MPDVHFTIDVPQGRQRFRELIIYIAHECANDPGFGATKLNKILFYSDMTAFERFGTPLTGMAYFRLDRGPAAEAMKPVERDLVNEGAVEIEERPTHGNYTQKRTIALRDADTDLFTRGELAIVDEFIRELWGKTANQVSMDSHKVAWRVIGHRELIPYEAAFLCNDDPTATDIKEARELNGKHQWGLRV